MATMPDDVGVDALLDSSPEPGVHTSAAAELAFLMGLVAVLSAPFSITSGVSVGTGVAALGLGVVGMVMTSKKYVAGKALVPLSLVLAVVAIAVVGLRFLGVDTAFGDAWVPTITGWLDALNAKMGY
ncbi:MULTISPECIES: hypothetical protein [Nocardioides]|uniref:Uncharacterized protein n=1 Tax=Nocardioides vastitatis TaxID=2568655 RepID=A0ABW0ZHG0_9ACTN|nr:hypothetical protein [Nocardioides sp.]THJ14731.1 hypothetical protein E7Z54_01020 [Nocardioides sp.]